MIKLWQAFLQERLVEWKLPKGDWTFLLLTITHPEGTNLVVLWFHDGGSFPAVVTKLCRDERILRWEYENLTRVHACAPDWTPRPLGFEKKGEFWALWMGGVPGLAFLPQSHSPAALRSMVEMLVAMHQAINKRGGWDRPVRYRRMIEDPLESVAQFRKVDSIESGVSELRARISAEWVDTLPVIPQHGDLFQGNLLVHGDRWNVVDWENFGRIDFPFFDLLTLLFSLLDARRVAPENWDVALVREIPGLTQVYAQKTGLSPEDLSRLLPLALANWFQLQCRDKRTKFASELHEIIRHYFEHRDVWHQAFLGSPAR